MYRMERKKFNLFQWNFEGRKGSMGSGFEGRNFLNHPNLYTNQIFWIIQQGSQW